MTLNGKKTVIGATLTAIGAAHKAQKIADASRAK